MSLFLIAVEPVSRECMGQLVKRESQHEQPEPAGRRGELPQLTLGGQRHARFEKPEYDEGDQTDMDPDRSSKPPAETDRRPGQKIGHVLHPRSSVFAARGVAFFALKSNLTAGSSARNASRRASFRATYACGHSKAPPWRERRPAAKVPTWPHGATISVVRRAAGDGIQLRAAREKRVRVELGARSYEIRVVSKSISDFGAFVGEALEATLDRPLVPERPDRDRRESCGTRELWGLRERT